MNHGKELNKLRKRYNKECKWCHMLMFNVLKRQAYCSCSCKSKAYRDRKEIKLIEKEFREKGALCK